MIVAKSGYVTGIDAFLIDVEVDIRPGLPGFEIVGLPSTTVKESRERVRSALRNSGFKFPAQKVIVNLAPAHYRKDGAAFDVAIAVGILAFQGVVDQSSIKNLLIVGELSLDGTVKPIPGVLSLAELAHSQNMAFAFPKRNQAEVALLHPKGAVPTTSLRQLVQVLNDTSKADNLPIAKYCAETVEYRGKVIQGQQTAKRALTIAAAGGHHILLVGPPGVGKTMLAKSAISLLPPLTKGEAVEISKIYSAAGLLQPDSGLMTKRPLRIPHHTSSKVSLIGGGYRPRPGEITLAHNGILVLDEFTEFSWDTLQALREPLDSKRVRLSRAHYSVSYPADFWLVATANPCPCGYLGSAVKACQCSQREIKKYQRKLSGPLLDRFDLFCILNPLSESELRDTKPDSWPQAVPRLSATEQKETKLSVEAENFLLTAQQGLQLSVRSYYKTLTVAQTIARLDGCAAITESHIAEALQYRPQTIGLS